MHIARGRGLRSNRGKEGTRRGQKEARIKISRGEERRGKKAVGAESRAAMHQQQERGKKRRNKRAHDALSCGRECAPETLNEKKKKRDTGTTKVCDITRRSKAARERERGNTAWCVRTHMQEYYGGRGKHVGRARSRGLFALYLQIRAPRGNACPLNANARSRGIA